MSQRRQTQLFPSCAKLPVSLFPLTSPPPPCSSSSAVCPHGVHFKNPSSLLLWWNSSWVFPDCHVSLHPSIPPLQPLHLSIHPNESLWCAQINNSVTSLLCSRSPVRLFAQQTYSLLRQWQIQVRRTLYIFNGTCEWNQHVCEITFIW